MTDPMTHTYDGPVEVITSAQRRRRWTTEEKVRIVEETYLPGNPASAGLLWRSERLIVGFARQPRDTLDRLKAG